MKLSSKNYLLRFRAEGIRRPHAVATFAMGTKRSFHAYDRGEDTFIFEKGVWTNLDAHASVILADKADLKYGAQGHLVTVTTGNHSVAALPLLMGKFWNLAQIPPERRSETMAKCLVCGNVVNGKLEISQREVPCEKVIACDQWLTKSLGVSLQNIVLVERNDATLDYYRRRGEEWRVRPLAWTKTEMEAALRLSRKRIFTPLHYFHSVKGVHFLTYPDFQAFLKSIRKNRAALMAQLREWTAMDEDHAVSFIRQPKFRGHHEIEFFGIPRGIAEERFLPAVEEFARDMAEKALSNQEVSARLTSLDALFKSLLARPELAHAESPEFIRTLYMCLTGEIYVTAEDSSAPAFDDRRTALPGASFENGRPNFHPGFDVRTGVLLSSLHTLMGKDERIEYANVYELRDDATEAEDTPLGEGKTREVVYKTNLRPLPAAFIEKRLAHPGSGYGGYMIARIHAFKALGINLPEYRLLRHRGRGHGAVYDYYIRTRCEGEILDEIPQTFLRKRVGGGEEKRVLSALALRMGDAAAQNFVMCKYDSRRNGAFYGIGKEIYRFEYDVDARCTMPREVSLCSIRGTLSWPQVACTEKNLAHFRDFHLGVYVRVLKNFAARHKALAQDEFAKRFFEGFSARLKALAWRHLTLRDAFSVFDPNLPGRYGFKKKWAFARWALMRNAEDLDELRKQFFAKMGGTCK